MVDLVVEDVIVDEPIIQDVVIDDVIIDELITQDVVIDDAIVEETFPRNVFTVIDDAIVDEPIVQDVVIDDAIVEEMFPENVFTVVDDVIIEDAIVEETFRRNVFTVVDDAIVDDVIIQDVVVDDVIIDEPFIQDVVVDDVIIDEPIEVIVDSFDNETMESKILNRLEVLEKKPGYQSGENIAQYRVVAIINQTAYLASNKDNHGNFIGGLALNNAETGAEVILFTEGYLSEPTWNWDIDKPLYLGDDGRMIQVPDFSGLFILHLGRVISPTEIVINIGEAIWL